MNVPHANELFIGSRWVAPQGSELADVVAPFGGRVIRQLPRPTVDDAKLAVAQAQEAFGAWAT